MCDICLSGKDLIMTNFFVRCMLFISSYFPLILIFCIFLIGKYPYWAAGIMAVGILSLSIMVLYFRSSLRTMTAFQDKVTAFQKHDADVMGYIASYLIPFVTFPLDNVQQTAALSVFVAVLLVVYVNSNMIYINPVLNLAGYHLYEVNIERSAQSHYFIARQRVVLGEMIRFVRLSDDIFLEKREKVK